MKTAKVRALAGAALAALLAAPLLASGAGDQQAQRVHQVQSVEELRDKMVMFHDQQVSVTGEVKDKLDARSFVLESGGILDDEIIVITSPKTRGLRLADLREDAEVVVTGTVRNVPLVEIQQETGWELGSDLEHEIQGARNFLIVDRISASRRPAR
jgi:hypothetical protein